MANSDDSNDPDQHLPDDDTPNVELIRFKDFASFAKVPEREHLTNNNWYNWKERMSRVSTSCAITGYIRGTIERPDKATNKEGSRNWLMDDN
jgi:hypothetical protein